MTIQLEISPESAARLAAEARARGIAPEEYAAAVLQDALASQSTPSGNLTLDGFHAMLGALRAGSEGLPNLPTEGFTRESFYEDRT